MRRKEIVQPVSSFTIIGDVGVDDRAIFVLPPNLTGKKNGNWQFCPWQQGFYQFDWIGTVILGGPI